MFCTVKTLAFKGRCSAVVAVCTHKRRCPACNTQVVHNVYVCYHCIQPVGGIAKVVFCIRLQKNVGLHTWKQPNSLRCPTLYAQFLHCLFRVCCHCTASENLLVLKDCHSAVYDDLLSAKYNIPYAFGTALWVCRAPCCSYDAWLHFPVL